MMNRIITRTDRILEKSKKVMEQRDLQEGQKCSTEQQENRRSKRQRKVNRRLVDEFETSISKLVSHIYNFRNY